MEASTQHVGRLTIHDLKGKVEPDWCPGCGDFGVLAAIQKALVELEIPLHNVVILSGIGCSSNLPGFINTYGMHTLHGRALAVATGLKLANHELTVIVTGGDGDGFGIGGNHFVHTMRRNVDLLYIVMDNQIYGLTTGQTSPTSRIGMKTKSMPFGNIEAPVNPISLALAVATGVKLANHALTVLVTGGDGDGFGIGGNHFMHTMRRNVDLLYIVMDNQIYGLTTGQTSPTSRLGMKTKSMPFGNLEAPVNPITMALAAGATFVARGFSGEQKHLTELIKQGIQHKGFSFLDVFSPCVTYNHDNTYQWFRPRVKKLQDDPAYEPSDWLAAIEKSLLWGNEIPIGKFFQRTDVPSLHAAEPVLAEGPLVERSPRVPAEAAQAFIQELM